MTSKPQKGVSGAGLTDPTKSNNVHDVENQLAATNEMGKNKEVNMLSKSQMSVQDNPMKSQMSIKNNQSQFSHISGMPDPSESEFGDSASYVDPLVEAEARRQALIAAEEAAEAERNAAALKAKKEELAEHRRVLLESRSKWTKKKVVMLVTFYTIATILGVVGIYVWVWDYIHLSNPPTEYAHDVDINSIFAFIGLSVLAPLGLVLILCRISNLVLGILYMFLLVLVISFATTGLSRTVYSYQKDTLGGSMRNYYAKAYKERKKLPSFYQTIAIDCDCCGFDKTDRIKEWPTYLQSQDFPYGCCKSSGSDSKDAVKTATQECSGLGYMYNKQRVPSGFFIITTPEKMEEWRGSNGLKAYDGFSFSTYQKSFSVEWLKKIFKNLCDDLLHRKEFAKSSLQFCDKDNVTLKLKTRASVATGPTDLQLLYDLLVDKWIAERVRPKELKRGTWLYFQFFMDDLNLLKINSVAGANGTNSTKKNVYYVTQGIVENILMEKVIRPRRCEKYIEESKCSYHDGFKLPPFKDSSHTHLHLTVMRMIVLDDAIMCVVVIFETLIMAILFWFFYSRLKANEQAALKPPTDFDLLNLELPDYDELDEAARIQEREMLKRRLSEKAKRIEQERMLRESSRKKRRSGDKKGKYKQAAKDKGSSKPSKGKSSKKK